eukprot:scaffold21342_cov66-Cyclotella_meneghiniana.AAC.2
MAFNFDGLLGPTLLIDKGLEVPTSGALKGKKYVMLYFSAHWCPPCRAYTPRLAEAYIAHIKHLEEALKSEGSNEDSGEIEVVFISLDSVKSEYDEYRSTMPWYSVPHDKLWQLNIKDDLSKRFDIKSIPTLIVLDGNTGEVITNNGKGEYATYFEGDYQVASSGCIIS